MTSLGRRLGHGGDAYVARESPGKEKRFYGWYIVALAFLVSSVSTLAQARVQAPVQIPMSRALGVSASALLTVNLFRAVSTVHDSPCWTYVATV